MSEVMKVRRSLPAIALALCGGVLFAASVALHVAALAGMDVQERWPVVPVMTLLVMALMGSVCLGPANPKRGPEWDWAKVLPRWSVGLAGAVAAYVAVNFVLFIVEWLVQSHCGKLVLQDGQPVLTRYGRTLRALSGGEYHWFRALELRGISGHWMLFSMLAALLWAKEACSKPGPREAFTQAVRGPSRTGGAVGSSGATPEAQGGDGSGQD